MLFLDDLTTIAFNSNPSFFHKEHAGTKNNTVRLITQSEYKQLRTTCSTIQISLKPLPAKYPKIFFLRTITDVSVLGELLGKKLVIITWGLK